MCEHMLINIYICTRIGEIIALHIDYANRPESSKEAAFVEQWCADLGIAFHKRVINEVTRGITDRSLYEKVSRDIRYDFYKEKLPLHKCQAVMFGHHLGDVQENVISNVMRFVYIYKHILTIK